MIHSRRAREESWDQDQGWGFKFHTWRIYAVPSSKPLSPGLQDRVEVSRCLRLCLCVFVPGWLERVRWRFYLPNHVGTNLRSENTREFCEDDQNTKDFWSRQCSIGWRCCVVRWLPPRCSYRNEHNMCSTWLKVQKKSSSCLVTSVNVLIRNLYCIPVHPA